MSGDKKSALDRDALRAMVRQVLRDALPEVVRERAASEAAKTAPARPAAEVAASKGEEVAIASDAELAAFVRRLLALAQDPKQREALQTGRLSFRLKRARKSSESDPTEPGAAKRGASERIDKGIVNERRVMAAAKAGKKLIVGKGVSVTPLARDKARQLGVQIERE